MRLFVTGGTGFIGRNLVPQLLANGHEVTCLVRHGSDTAHLGSCRLARDYGGSYDAVVHAAGIKGGPGVSRDDLFDANAGTTEKVLKSFPDTKVVFISSAGVLGPVVDADEGLAHNPTNDYEDSKSAAEKMVVARGNCVVLRPEFLYGPNDLHVLQLFRAMRGWFPLIGGGESLLHPTFVDDLVQAVLLALQQDNGIYNVAGERALAVRDLHGAVCTAMGLNPRSIVVPKAVSYMASLLPGPMTKSRHDFFTKSRTFDTSKLRSIGYEPVALEQGLRKTVGWYREEGLL